ncbi:MAG TPA: MOSC domain-containing protein, partial [Pyrinomonadaceae bacterium]|nr:MOSC domain-containing protein [Pyrinomonadaceae bacterium]
RYREAPRNGFIPHVDMRFPDGVEAGSDLADINERLTQLLGKRVSLSSSAMGDQFDAYPIHVLTTASLEVMSRWNTQANWDVRRFRPNIFIETEPGIEGFVEFGWKKLRVGGVELLCEMPAERCAMTTHAQAELGKDPSVLRSIVEAADQNLGVYASVIAAGEVRVGDQVDAD